MGFNWSLESAMSDVCVYSIEIFPTERFSLYLGLGVVELGMIRCKRLSVYSMV